MYHVGKPRGPVLNLAPDEGGRGLHSLSMFYAGNFMRMLLCDLHDNPLKVLPPLYCKKMYTWRSGFKPKPFGSKACILSMTQVLQAKFLVPSKAGPTGSCYTTNRHLQGGGRHLPTWFSLFLLLPLDANNSILLSLPHRWASPLWATETCTQRPTWAGFLPSSALLLESSSMGCPYPSSTTNSLITTASSRLTSTRPYGGRGGMWSSCKEPERR